MQYQHSLARDGGCTRPNCLQPGYHWGPPQPGLDTPRRHRRRQTVLRLRPRPQTRHRRPLPPASPTPAAWPGPTAPHHPTSTTPTTPKKLLHGNTDPPHNDEKW